MKYIKHLNEIKNGEYNKRFDYEIEYGPSKKGEWIFNFKEEGNKGCLKDISPIIIHTEENDFLKAKEFVEDKLKEILGADWENKLVDIKPVLGRFVIERFFEWYPDIKWEEYK